MEKIKIFNSNGQNIAAIIDRPAAKTEKLAILCPGYLDTKDYAHLASLANELTKQGYTVVRFDPTGTWESEGDISEYLTSQYLEDIGSVLERMLREGKYTHVLLGGHSRGGQVSVLYAARDPRISQVLGIMPSHGLMTGKRREDWEKTGVSISQRDLPNEGEGMREYRVPFQHVLDREQYDALNEVKKIKVPIVFIAGELDILVPPEKVKKLFDNANEPKKFILAQGIDHEYRHRPAEIEKINALALKGLERNPY